MSMSDRDGVIWYDGKLVPWREAKTHVLTHTLHYGMGVFEGVRAYATAQGPSIFRLKEHTNRLFNSAHIMNMAMPFSQAEINEAHRTVVRENKLPHAYLRPMAFYGSEGMGLRASNLKVHVIVAAWEWPAYMSPEALDVGIKAYDAGDYRWSSTVFNHIVFADPANELAKKWLAASYEQQGFQAEAGTWRNVFLQAAHELLRGVVPHCAGGQARARWDG